MSFGTRFGEIRGWERESPWVGGQTNPITSPNVLYSTPDPTHGEGRVQGFLFGTRTIRTASVPSEEKGSDFPRSEGNDRRGRTGSSLSLVDPPPWLPKPFEWKDIHPKHACPASSVYPSNHLQTPNQLRPFPWDLRCHPFAKITTGNPSMTSGPLRAQQPCKSACDGPKDRKMCLSNRILQENHVPERSASQ